MIEFKAECGHTVRAKDEDAGGVVRCSYCGQPANVPDNQANGDIDFLFNEVEQREQSAGGERRRKGSRIAGLFRRRRRGPDDFNPFALIAKLCWAALLISVVVFVSKKYVLPLFEPDGRTSLAAKRGVKTSRRKAPSAASDRPKRSGMGLIGDQSPIGLYVASTPPGASTYWFHADEPPPRGTIAFGSVWNPSDSRSRKQGKEICIQVVFAWNDRRLTGYEGYLQFRKEIEHSSDAMRRKRIAEYFLPDGASEVFVQKTVDQTYLVRQYCTAQPSPGQTKAIRSLFLPRITNPDGVTFNVRALVTEYIPERRTYEFDADHVRAIELEYYGVPHPDQQYVLEALHRIGVLPYVTLPDRRMRLFKIGPCSGVFAVEDIGVVNE